VLYMTFDNTGVGREMAKIIYPLVPEGNYAIIKGNEPDENTRFLRAGMEEVIGEAVANGDIDIVCETYTDNWAPELAQTNMENCLTAVDNDIDAVLAENDGMAGGVIAALEAQGLSVPVSGQDGDKGALNRVAQGRQAVSVWKDSRVLGDQAGKAAVAMAQGTPMEEIEGVFDFVSPSGETLNTVYVEMDVLTQDNLQEAVDRGRITQEELCVDVEPGSVPACP
jgi:D-xylose transport system substrate-binding protein